MKILIVEDVKIQRKALESVLRTAGYETVSAGSVTAGLKACAQHRPDMILADVNLPDGNGFDLCSSVKTDARLAHIPVILLTGDAVSVDQRVSGLQTGADDYVLKPYSEPQLLARMRAIFDASAARRR